MNAFNKLLIATIAILCLNFNAQAFQSPTLPYDLFIVGLDSDINTSGDDQIVLMASRDITDGFQFGITNGLLNDGQWETRDAAIEYINIKYTGGDLIPKGAAVKIDISSTDIDIQENGKSISDAFSISYSSNYNGDFIKSSSFFVSVYNGILTGSGSKHYLLGSTLDVLAYGITETERQSIILPTSVDNKEFLLDPQSGTLAKRIDRDNCDLCDILLLILFSDNWLNITNTYGFDLDAITFDIRNCIQVNCPGDLLIDTLDCNTLIVSSMPCDTILEYEWTQIVNGQFFPLESGTSGPVPNLVLDGKGYYQLTITCSDSCIYTSNIYYADCFEGPCDFNIEITEDSCVVSVSLVGCPGPDYQWYVLTDNGSYLIPDSDTSSIDATENGSYYVEVTGCPDCEVTSSDTINVNCGIECSCELDFTLQNCIIYLDTTNCIGYNGLLEYKEETSTQWIYVPVNSFPYYPAEYGNGFYRYTLGSESCDTLTNTLFVNCIKDCDSIEVIGSPTNECFLEFNWIECNTPNYELYYAEDCVAFNLGGGTITSEVINPDGSGTVIYDPYYSTGCYKLLLSCDEDCNFESNVIEIEECCTSDLEISVDSCIISVINISCTGSYEYTLYINGNVFETDTASGSLTIPVDENGLTYLEIECDSCTYSSNTILLNCGDDPCAPEAKLAIEDCILTAFITDCPNASIQWQEEINGVWIDITGETNTTYDIIVDGTFQYYIQGCGCTDPDTLIFYSPEITTTCVEQPCTCDISIGIDTLNCTIVSTDVDCDLIEEINWYFELDSANWVLLPEYTNQNNITPDQNGIYKKVVTTKDGCVEEEEITVTCIDECLEIVLTIEEPEDCTIKVSWDGCYDVTSYFWEYIPAIGELITCTGTFIPATYDSIQFYSNELSGEGFSEIQPTDEGCYKLTIVCNDTCLSISITVPWTQCCSEDAEVIYQDITDELCDYCFPNACTDSLFDISVTIDASSLWLSGYENFFDFPYCDNGNAYEICLDTDCGDLPDFGQLTADINNWFAYFGYEGTANQGGNNGACKAEFSPIWIEQTNVIFNFAYFWEPESTNSVIINQDTITWQGGGTQYVSFIQTNCTDTIFGPSLKIINACEGATYLWSTQSTSQTIPYQTGVNYSVTVTCPDGCSEVFTYGGSAGSMITHETVNATEANNIIDQTTEKGVSKQFKVYPNPATERINVEYMTEQKGSAQLVFYTNTGMMVMRKVMNSQRGGNTKTIDVSNLKSGIYFIQLLEGGVSHGFQKVAIIK